MQITTREQFKTYVLRNNGYPVIKVNVSDDQLEDRIDEAVDYWNQYHNEGTIQMWMKQQVTASEIHVVEDFEEIPIEKIVGTESGATAQVSRLMQGKKNFNKTIFCYGVKENSFKAGEKITVGDKTFTIEDSETAVVRGIIDTHAIKMPNWVIGVTQIVPFHETSSSEDLLSLQSQIKINIFDIFDLTSTSLIYYEQMMEHLSLLNYELNARPSFDFNRHEGNVYPLCNWGIDIHEGDYILLRVYRMLDPSQVPEIWNNTWLKRYATVLVKKNWAVNLKKYSGIQLAGGTTLNGSEMYTEAVQEQKELEEELMRDMPPSAFFIG